MLLRNEIETKLNELRAVMTAGGLQQTGEKLLIFAESRETLEYLAEKLRFTFDKQTARSQEAVFVAPGHPLLETVIERLQAECAPDVRRGATLVWINN